MADLDPDRLSRTMAELARSFDGAGTDLDTALRRITTAAVELIPGTDSADVLVITGRGKFESHAATSQLPPQIDALQARVGEGPCVDSAVDTVFTRSDDLAAESRWPMFTAAAVEAGVRSVVSFRLYTHDMQAGALNLFSAEANAFDEAAIHIGEVLAAHAAIAFVSSRRQMQLHSAIASRDLIGQAKGMLMERFAVDADRAFAMMVALSQESNVPVATIAARIVDLGPQSAKLAPPNYASLLGWIDARGENRRADAECDVFTCVAAPAVIRGIRDCFGCGRFWLRSVPCPPPRP